MYLTCLEWVAARENLVLIGPAGTGKTHTLLALGHAAVTAGHKVRYLTAADLIETLYRALADNIVGKTIETLLRNDLLLIDEVGFAPWTTPARNCSSGSSPQPTNAAPWASPQTGHSRTGAGSCPNTPPPSACSTGSCTTVVTTGQSYRMREARTRTGGRPTQS